MSESVQRAFAAFQRGDVQEAERLCRSVLDSAPGAFEALYLLGIVAGGTGRTQEAVEYLTRATAASPGSADAHFNRGVALGELGRLADALDSYERAIALRPGHADACYNRGIALAALGRPAEAFESYGRAIAVRPDFAEAYNNRGIVLEELGRPDEALAGYERAIALRPGYAAAHNHRGHLLGELGRHDEALASFERALAVRPDYAEAWNNRGLVLLDVDRVDDALASFERALAHKPAYAEALYNRGNALRERRRHRDAVASYERAIAARPDYDDAHWNLADCLLLLGEFERGWREYAWRFRSASRGPGTRGFTEPIWLGDTDPRAKTVLLHAELGLGDTLLLCRYAREVAALGANVVLEVQAPLRPLLANLDGAARVLARGDPLPPFDLHCPLTALPFVFRAEPKRVPLRIPYVQADPAVVAEWALRLGARARPRIGIVWSGSTALRKDTRSMALAELRPLLRDWADWVSLQKEVSDADAALVASLTGVRHFGSDLADFAVTAALIENLDLVVTVDTAVANLAGAMGKEVWILVPFTPHDWRWLLDREDSFWYPTARLFRQPSAGDWRSVIRRIDADFARKFVDGA